MENKKNRTYSIKCKGNPTPSNPCFIHFGKRKGKGNIVGEIIKRTEPNTIGNMENLVLIKFTAGASQTQDDIIDNLKKGEFDVKRGKSRERNFFRE